MSRQKVLGLGGVFFRARNAEALRKWYLRHLGVDVTEWGGAAFQQQADDTIYWSVFEEKSDYMPRRQLFMLNWRVADLDAILNQFRAADIRVEEHIESSGEGRFGWAYDLEGNKFELWEPPKA